MTWTDNLSPRERANLVDAGRIGRDGGPYVPVPAYRPATLADLTKRLPGIIPAPPQPPALSCSSCRALPVRVQLIEAQINPATGNRPAPLYRCAWCGWQATKAEAERGRQ